MSDNANLIVGTAAGGSDGTGLGWFGATGTTAPTDATTALNAGFLNAGGISEEGLTVSFSKETTDVRFYGSRVVQRTVTTSEKQTFKLKFMEHNEVSLAVFHGKTLTAIVPAVSTGAFSITTGISTQQRYAFVGQIVDGSNVTRIYCPNVEVTQQGDVQYSAGQPVGYDVTLTAYPVSGVSISWFYAIPNLG